VLAAICPKQEPKDRTEVTELEKLIKQMQVLRDGTKPTETTPGKEPYPSPALDGALELLEERVALLKLNAVRNGAQFTLIPAKTTP
jgi:hypothetical protein